MLKLKELSLKNFFSIGQATQSISFDEGSVTLVLGANPDYGDGIRNGVGKAQPLSAKVLTPYGWKTMKDIGVGDFVYTPKGTTSVVMGKYPQGSKTIYEIKTSDGKRTRACKEHLWTLYIGDDYGVYSTEDIYHALVEKKSVTVPVISEVGDKTAILPIHPYVAGLSISSASLRDGAVVFEDVEYEVIHKLKVYLSEQDYDLTYSRGNITATYKHSTLDPVISFLDEIYKSDSRYIPENFFEGSYYQRRDLMMGFHDALASQDEDKVVMFLDIKDSTLANDLQRLSWSLSGVCSNRVTAYTIKDKFIGTGNNSEILISARYPDANKLFSLETKRQFPVKKDLRSTITSISTLKKQEAVCIKIADSDSLYITDDYIPTHNTTIINGLSYALFGKPITVSRQDDMINNINGKNMLVSLTFEVNGVTYSIERGRKPNILRLLKVEDGKVEVLSDDNSKTGDSDNRAQGENKDTQKEIERITQLSYILLKYIVAMNTYSTHFMTAGASEQREVIENILGIDVLSRKAEVLSERIKVTKIDIDKETIKIETINESNNRILRNIESLKNKATEWDSTRDRSIIDLMNTLEAMGDLDIDDEISKHKRNAEIQETQTQIRIVKQEYNHALKNQQMIKSELDRLERESNSFKESVCPTCKQEISDKDAHEKHKTKLLETITSKTSEYENLVETTTEYKTVIDSIEVPEALHETFYPSLERALEHKNTMLSLIGKVEEKQKEENPYARQIENLESGDMGVQDIDYNNLKFLEKKLSHEKFLYKLLTNRDSFIRKRIIDYSLPFLNKILQGYITRLSLPHEVVFDPNLTFSIEDKARPISFNNLSRGEQNRVTFALNLAFRGLYESLVQPINCLFVDEILDYGMDSVGAKDSVYILKEYCREMNKAVYLVTHKEELMEYANKTILVTKENGFTTYEHIDK